MEKFKEFIKDRTFAKWSFFIVFNAVVLYIIYFLIKNCGLLMTKVSAIASVMLDAFWPLVIGLILAYLLNPLSEFIDHKLITRMVHLPTDPIKSEKRSKLLHFLSVLLTYILVIAVVISIIYGFTVLIVGKVAFSNLSATIDSLINGFLKYESSFRGWVSGNVPEGFISDKIIEATNAFVKWLSNNFNASSIVRFFTNIGGNILDVVIGIIISIYLMKDKEYFLRLWRKLLHLLLPQKTNAVITETLSEINGVLSMFIRGALLDALFVAILSCIGLSLMGLEGAIFIGIFAGMANVIPYFGPIMGMIPAFLMGLCTDGFWHGAIAVIILLIVQQIDSNIIYPKVVGSSTGLHPLMVLLSVSVFGYFGGILGMLIAVPIAGIIQVFVVKWAQEKEKKITSPESESSSQDI